MRDNDTRVNYLPVKRTQLKARASLHALYIPGLSMCFLPQYSCISQTFFGDQIPVAPYARSLYSLLTEWGGGLKYRSTYRTLCNLSCLYPPASRPKQCDTTTYPFSFIRTALMHSRPSRRIFNGPGIFSMVRYPDNSPFRGVESTQMRSISGALLPVKGRRSAGQAFSHPHAHPATPS
jgi:hypothetical protein